VIKVVGTTGSGINDLYEAVISKQSASAPQTGLLVERTYQLIQKQRMKGIHKTDLKAAIDAALAAGTFNLFNIARSFMNKLDPTDTD